MSDEKELKELLKTIALLEAATYRSQAQSIATQARQSIVDAVNELQASINRFNQVRPTAILRFTTKVTAAIARHAPAVARDGWLAGGGDRGGIPRTLLGIAQGVVEVAKYIRDQVRFLGDWIRQIQLEQRVSGGAQRGTLYANSLMGLYNEMWSKAKTDIAGMPKLPAVPRDGTTQCLMNCNCHWEIRRGQDDGEWLAYWRLSPVENCETCLCRARRWNPLKFTAVGGNWVTEESGTAQCELYR